MNEVLISGKLVRDPEVKFTTNNTPKCVFTIVHNTGEGVREKAHFFRCIAWKAIAEEIGNSYLKGNDIEVKGILTQNSWEKDGEKKSIVEIVVFKHSGKAKKEADPDPVPDNDDDVPF